MRRQAGPLAGPHRLAGARAPSRPTACPLDETFRVYTLAVPTWDAWADIYYKIYDNEIGYIFHRQFNLAGADLAPAFWLMYNDPTKTARATCRRWSKSPAWPS